MHCKCIGRVCMHKNAHKQPTNDLITQTVGLDTRWVFAGHWCQQWLGQRDKGSRSCSQTDRLNLEKPTDLPPTSPGCPQRNLFKSRKQNQFERMNCHAKMSKSGHKQTWDIKAALKRQLMNYSKCVSCLPQGNLSKAAATNLLVKKKQTLAKAQSWWISFHSHSFLDPQMVI